MHQHRPVLPKRRLSSGVPNATASISTNSTKGSQISSTSTLTITGTSSSVASSTTSLSTSASARPALSHFVLSSALPTTLSFSLNNPSHSLGIITSFSPLPSIITTKPTSIFRLSPPPTFVASISSATSSEFSAALGPLSPAVTSFPRSNSPVSFITSVVAVPTVTPTSGVSSTSRTGFWQNKGAVAGTFTVVGLVLVGCLVAIVAALFKRRSNIRRHHNDSEDFKGLTVQRQSDALCQPTDPSPSPRLSAADLSSQQPMEPHGLLPPHYGATAIYENGPKTLSPTSAPVVSASGGRGVRNSYQPSVDSFYGA